MQSWILILSLKAKYPNHIKTMRPNHGDDGVINKLTQFESDQFWPVVGGISL